MKMDCLFLNYPILTSSGRGAPNFLSSFQKAQICPDAVGRHAEPAPLPALLARWHNRVRQLLQPDLQITRRKRDKRIQNNVHRTDVAGEI
jgi:hypothetical protein